MSRTIPARPALNDPVVVDGTKYRIWGFVGGLWDRTRETCVLRDHFSGRLLTGIAVASLTWDKVAGVWRVAT